MEITLSMIVKNETDDLRRCLESVKGYVDDIVIINTGNNPETSKIIKEYGTEYKYGWCNDFSKARNFALEKVKTEVVLWLDADDTVVGAENIPELKQRFNNPHLGALWAYYDYDQDKDGNTIMVVWRERIFRKKYFKWSGKLHEECLKQFDCIQEKIPKETLYIKHHPSDKRIRSSAERNLEISEANYYEGINKGRIDPFDIWNYARSLNAVGYIEDAEKRFIEFIEATQSDEHRYQSLQVLGEIYRKTRRYEKALDADLRCIKIRPRWANAYFALARTYFVMEDWDNVIFYSNLGFKMENPGEEIPVPFNPMELTYRPLEPLSYALVQKAKFEEALVVVQKALEIKPDSEYFKNWAEILPTAIHNREIEKSCWSIYEYLKENEKGKIKPFIECLPTPAKDHPEFVYLRNMFRGYKDGSNRIVIYCGASYDLWDANSEKYGIGGSEEAVINISRELVSLGWEVEVYNNCLDEGIYDGVKWSGIWKYDKEVPCRVFIAWRDTRSIMLAPEGSHCVLWLHDVCKNEYFTPDQIERVDDIFVLSQWHRECLPDIPDDKFWQTTNGIKESHFLEKVKRNPKACFYASSPDRGLDRVLENWGRIKKEVPDAELHIFYGFTKVYDELHKNNENMKLFKQKCMELMKQDGITYHGMVPHKELAKWMLYCGLWLYPTSFTEISPVHGDTKIETLNGRHKIKDLVGKSGFNVYSCDADGKLSISKVNGVFKTRENAKMLRVGFKPYTGVKANKIKYLTLTPDHEVMLSDGSYKEAGKLELGDSVKAFHRVKDGWGKGYDIRWQKRKLSNHNVVLIEEASNSDAFCMEVEPDHNFVANGIFVHNCISAMKAQAAGAIPITTKVAALNETVQWGKKFDGFDGGVTENTMKLWTDTVIEYLKYPEKQDEIREDMMKWAIDEFEWSNVAQRWSDRFRKVAKNVERVGKK